MGATTYPPLAELLDRHGLTGAAEAPFEHDGWSGAALTRLRRASDGAAFVLKRDSLARDWIARATHDVPTLREARLVHAAPSLPVPVRLPHLGVGQDGDEVALLMPDLTGTLLRWEAPAPRDVIEGVIAALARLHAVPWHEQPSVDVPWTDLRRRVLLLTRSAAAEYEAAGNPVGERFRLGWDAFDRQAPADARSLIDELTRDAGPLLDALRRLPVAGLHGDLKLGNVGWESMDVVVMIDWQMTIVAPVAVELGWFLVCNVAGLPLEPAAVLERYRAAAGRSGEAWAAERDLAILVGLVLRGWRKGLDAEAALTLPTGWSAAEDLAWWGREAVAAARRRL